MHFMTDLAASTTCLLKLQAVGVCPHVRFCNCTSAVCLMVHQTSVVTYTALEAYSVHSATADADVLSVLCMLLENCGWFLAGKVGSTGRSLFASQNAVRFVNDDGTKHTRYSPLTIPCASKLVIITHSKDGPRQVLF